MTSDELRAFRLRQQKRGDPPLYYLVNPDAVHDIDLLLNEIDRLNSLLSVAMEQGFLVEEWRKA